MLETMRHLPTPYSTITSPIQLLLAKGLEHEAGGARAYTARRVADHADVRVKWIDSADHHLHVAALGPTIQVAIPFLQTHSS